MDWFYIIIYKWIFNNLVNIKVFLSLYLINNKINVISICVNNWVI